ncbi:hypothetical protein PVK06_039275 [Gossypium arboreum]|uniref:Uncharacterized protein n=1 Tax=Gossypium arboreum TaxID=29729 RepID=A0ABR0N2N5_GOSAR|nr:hypothetical protein PVK06_039275 [Gossypium arboreum]
MFNGNYRWPKNQLGQIPELLQHRAREQASVDDSIESDNAEVEEEVLYEIVERKYVKVDVQQKIEVRELIEVLGVKEKISNSSEVSVEEPPNFLDVLEETP